MNMYLALSAIFDKMIFPNILCLKCIFAHLEAIASDSDISMNNSLILAGF